MIYIVLDTINSNYSMMMMMMMMMMMIIIIIIIMKYTTIFQT